MMESQLGHRTKSRHISTAWGAIHRCFESGGYQALGRRPGAEEPWRPDIYKAHGMTPVRAYRELERMTGRRWHIAMSESDFKELSPRETDFLRSTVPALRLITPFVYAWGESIWKGHTTSPDHSIGAWLAFVAAQADELIVRDLS